MYVAQEMKKRMKFHSGRGPLYGLKSSKKRKRMKCAVCCEKGRDCAPAERYYKQSFEGNVVQLDVKRILNRPDEQKAQPCLSIQIAVENLLIVRPMDKGNTHGL